MPNQFRVFSWLDRSGNPIDGRRIVGGLMDRVGLSTSWELNPPLCMVRWVSIHIGNGVNVNLPQRHGMIDLFPWE